MAKQPRLFMIQNTPWVSYLTGVHPQWPRVLSGTEPSVGPAQHVRTGDYYAALPAPSSPAGGSQWSSLSAETHSDDAVGLPEELSSLWLDVENSHGARNVKRVSRSRDVALSSSEDKLTLASNWTRSPANDRRRQMRCIRNENECQEVDILMEKIPECLPDLKSCIERWTTLESLGCWQNIDLRVNIIIGALWGGPVSLICESCGLSHDLFSQRVGLISGNSLDPKLSEGTACVTGNRRRYS